MTGDCTPPAFDLLVWADHRTWVPPLTDFLRSRLKRGTMARLRAADTEDFYADDPEWLKLLDHELRGELDEVKKELADALRGSRVRVFHGCRTDDAGVYFREGLKVHRWDELIAQVRALVDADEHRRDRKSVIEQTIAELGNYRNLDEGHSYVVLDERPLIEDSAHYL